MAMIHVDGRMYQVHGAENLLQACLTLGLDIPYFCWHPALGSVGACRQCAVKQYKDENDKHGKLVMSCMTPATDNTWISIGDAEAQEFRKSLVEWLMVNHPHDCPVCEEGGHCHLQDMTVMAGHTQRRYRFAKRTHRNQDLGPFINHEMNRCIACYRCVRYYRDYADGRDLGVFGAHDDVYFGRAEDGPLESEFSGNLTEVCPTGVFTDKTHSERYTRKWDMQFAPSVCAHCAVGCNVSPGERYSEIRRIENRYHGEINGYFLCDRGRFGYGHVNDASRPRRPLLRRDDKFAEVKPAEILAQLGTALRGGKKLIGIGSPRASLESNFALRQLVGAGNFSTGMNALEQRIVRRMLEVLRAGPSDAASLSEIDRADAVLVLGEDVTQTAPRLALAIRQAARGKALELAALKHIPAWQADAVKDVAQGAKHPVFVASVGATRLDDIAARTYRAAPADIARLGFAVANRIDPSAPAPRDLSADAARVAEEIAQNLKTAKRPVIVAGCGLASEALIEAAANVAWALNKHGVLADLAFTPAECNSMGVALMGGLDLEAALARASQADALIVLENDLYRRLPAEKVDATLAATQLIALDHQRTATTDKAHALLPAASVFEGDGTFVNYETRAQRHFQVFDPAAFDRSIATQESWRWIEQLLEQIGGAVAPDWKSFDEVCAACAAEVDALAGITQSAPSARFRVRGMKLARAPHRYSGRTAMLAHLSVHEPRVTQDADTALAFSMEGYAGGARPTPLIPFVWAPSWNSPQALNKFQDEVGGHLRGGDPGVRLIGSAASNALKYFQGIPAAFTPRTEGLRGIIRQHIFTSDELAARAKPIQARAPAMTLVLNPADAARLNLEAGDPVSCALLGQHIPLTVVLETELPAGLAGLPGQLAGMVCSGEPLWVKPELAEVEV